MIQFPIVEKNCKRYKWKHVLESLKTVQIELVNLELSFIAVFWNMSVFFDKGKIRKGCVSSFQFLIQTEIIYCRKNSVHDSEKDKSALLWKWGYP